jgi:hypothetical protein
MSRLVEIHQNYIKELFLFFSEEYTRMFYTKCESKDELKALLTEKITNQLNNHINHRLISDYRIEVETNFNLAIRRDNIIEAILNDSIPDMEQVTINFYYRLANSIEFIYLQICINTYL